MDKVAKEKIKELKSQGEYDEIYRQFGIKAYKKYVPASYRKQDLLKLKREGRYMDIFNKYGKDEYNKILKIAMYYEIKEARGVMPAVLWRAKDAIKTIAKETGLYSLVGMATISGMLSVNSAAETKENYEEYKQEIEEYNNNIRNYAEDVKQYGFSDLQIFMKVMDDMWANIKGYANPEKDIHGFFELDLATEEGYGVCRNMASDVARKLNEINPEYNARIIPVLLGKDGGYEIADIERKVYETNETVVVEQENSEIEQEESAIGEKVVNIFGNHMVTLVDVPEDNITLVLDPTNPGLGVYIDGQIKMFNSDKANGLEFSAKEWSSAVFVNGGIKGPIDVVKDYVKSFGDQDIEELSKKYGVQAQNEALDITRNRVATRSIVEKTFDERYKYDGEIVHPNSEKYEGQNPIAQLEIEENTQDNELEVE